jgi:hypothetical protein
VGGGGSLKNANVFQFEVEIFFKTLNPKYKLSPYPKK